MQGSTAEDYSEFGLILRYFRKKQGMTIRQLVNLTGFSCGTISKLENGLYGRAPSKKFIASVASALHINPEALMFEVSPENILDKCVRDFYRKGLGINNKGINLREAINRVLSASHNSPTA